MGKLKDSLLEQLKSKDIKERKRAEDCLKIYEKLFDLDKAVYEFKWRVLVDVKIEGNYPYNHIYIPSEIGKIFLIGMQK